MIAIDPSELDEIVTKVCAAFREDLMRILNKEKTMTKMRAKMQVSSVFPHRDEQGQTTSETLHFHGVSKSDGYPADGSDEDNSFAKWSPSINLTMQVTNPALFGKFEPGQKFYVDFSPAVQTAA